MTTVRIVTSRLVSQGELFDTLDAVAADWRPSRVEARLAIRDAIHRAAAAHGGLVHIAQVRIYLPEWIDGHQIGALISALTRKGNLTPTGRFRPNGGPSGNASKPAEVRRLRRLITVEDVA
jgi:hypothetical protein